MWLLLDILVSALTPPRCSGRGGFSLLPPLPSPPFSRQDQVAISLQRVHCCGPESCVHSPEVYFSFFFFKNKNKNKTLFLCVSIYLFIGLTVRGVRDRTFPLCDVSVDS